jgi:hypothetical protein
MNFVGFADAIDSDPAPALWWVVHAGSGMQIVCVPADSSDAAVQKAVQKKTGDKTHVRIEERCAADREIRVSRVDDRERLIALGGNGEWRDTVASWQLCKPVSSWLGAEFEGNTVVQLNLSSCGLTGKLNVSNCVALTHLVCYNNRLQALDVSSCAALTQLYCYNNHLRALDVSSCVELVRLVCYNNRLQALDVASCVLAHLLCSNNHLQALDVSSCVALARLHCYDNRLQALDVSSCVTLTHLNCYHNHLQVLDVSSCVALTKLYCSNNQPATFKLIGWPRS